MDIYGLSGKGEVWQYWAKLALGLMWSCCAESDVALPKGRAGWHVDPSKFSKTAFGPCSRHRIPIQKSLNLTTGEMGMILAIDIGATKITSAFWDGKNLIDIEKFDTPQVSAPEFISWINDHLSERVDSHRPEALGVSSAGPINVKDGALINPVNLGNKDDSWRRVELKRSLLPDEEIFRWVDSDAALAAYAEYCRRGKRDKDLVAVTIGTGIGVGAIVQGQIVRGGRGMHPELGHLIISEDQSEEFPTPFANFGTMESFLSGHFFAQRVSRLLKKELSGKELIQMAKEGNSTVLECFEAYARRMAIGLANICLVYAPSHITLGGGFAESAAPFFLKRTLFFLEEILHSRSIELSLIPQVEIAHDTHHLPLLGAAYAASDFKSQV